MKGCDRMRRHLRWLLYCQKIVEKSNSHYYKHVAILVRHGSLFKVGFNKYKSGYVKNKLYVERGIHAELDLLCKIDPDDLKNAILYTMGQTHAGKLVKGKPCPICQQLISQYPIKAIYYFDENMKVCQLENCS